MTLFSKIVRSVPNQNLFFAMTFVIAKMFCKNLFSHGKINRIYFFDVIKVCSNNVNYFLTEKLLFVKLILFLFFNFSREKIVIKLVNFCVCVGVMHAVS
jgi:hypothetical protein